jgi:hypothetical protein
MDFLDKHSLQFSIFSCAFEWCAREEILLQKRCQTGDPLSPHLFVLTGDLLQSDRGDLILKLDLGRARDAVGKLAMTLMPLLIPAEIEARAAPAAPAAPEPKKK